jgi:hypothetical protein
MEKEKYMQSIWRRQSICRVYVERMEKAEYMEKAENDGGK